jgi:hypothetical protein
VPVAKTEWIDIEGTVGSVDGNGGREGYTVVFTYVVDGHWCGGTFTTFDAYRVGDTLAVRYDAKDPDRNDLSEKAKRTRWLIWIIVPVVFLIFILVRLFT